MKIYTSTGAFRTRNIIEILNIAGKNGIRELEISPGLDYCENIKEILLSEKDNFNFLIHNYFPTPKVPFALNLASDDPEISLRSMNMCKEAVDFLAKMDIPYYSVHCGYCFDTDGRALGKKEQVSLPRIPYKKAKDAFTGRIRELCDYAGEKNIGIAIENNVMADFAKGDKQLYLGVDTEDLKELIEDINRPNVGILLDLAHAQVSDSYLRFGLENMIRELRPFLMEVHVSENNGLTDQNFPLEKDSRMLSYLRLLDNVPVTIEVYNLSENEILGQIRLLDDEV